MSEWKAEYRKGLDAVVCDGVTMSSDDNERTKEQKGTPVSDLEAYWFYDIYVEECDTLPLSFREWKTECETRNAETRAELWEMNR